MSCEDAFPRKQCDETGGTVGVINQDKMIVNEPLSILNKNTDYLE